MASSLSSLLTSMLALPDLDRETVTELLYSQDKRPMVNQTLRLRPGTRVLIDRLSDKLHLSQAEMVGLIVESTLRDVFLPVCNSALSIIDRFEVVLEAHDLNLPDVAQMLSPWNIKLSVLQDRERTMDYLTTPLLQSLARWFYLSPDWCLGHDVKPLDTQHDQHQWPQTENEFRELLISTDFNEVHEIIFWTKLNAPETVNKNKTGILIKRRANNTEVNFQAILSINPTRLNINQTKWVERLIESQSKTCPVRSVNIPNSLATALEQGTTLPSLILRQI